MVSRRTGVTARRHRGALTSTVAVMIVGSLLLFLCMVFSPTAAIAAPEYESLTGANRYQTAIEVSQAGFDPGVGAAVLVTGENYPDALSAAPLAAAYGGPVLLTHSVSLDEETRAELARLQPGKVFVVGLDTQVIDQVTTAFPELGSTPGGIVALVGLNRYETASLVAEEVKAKLGTVTGVVLASGDSFADALSVAPLAAAKGWPILLTPGSGPIPETTLQTLGTLGASVGLAVGIYADPGLADLAFTHLVGGDRYQTSVLIAEYAANEGMSYGHIAVVTGDNFPDGLAAGPYLARDGGIIVLTKSKNVPASLASFLVNQAETLGRVDFIGLGPAVVGQIKLLLSAGDLPDGFGFGTLRWGSEGVEVAWLEQRLTDLTYRPGPIDGVFDKCTHQAVLAFQKWEGLGRDGIVGSNVWSRILGAVVPTPSVSRSGTWLEVNKAKQVLLYVQDGTVLRTLAVSTGNPDVGIVTPSRTFTVYAKSPKWDGPRYKPLYLKGILAIHGYPSVPAWPASHGCVRVPLWDMDELFPLVPVGTKVYVY